MSKYLYGASVQGIQEFIFATNKLKEIVGASEIVKSITDDFEKEFKSRSDVEILLCAAGNIKAVFTDKDTLQNHILEFEKNVMQRALGISISQAIVKYDTEVKEQIPELEKRLKIQRNKPSIAPDLSLNIMKLNPSTAKALVNKDSDQATKQKLNQYKSIEKDEQFKELKNLSNSKNKIAVIHIDGNGLGQLIPKLKNISEFSKKLDIATKQAFEDAKQNKKIREIILGGDDVTVICDADDALDFTKEFLENFEKETKNFQKLTACAGIAYCNEKYPFHYAVDLAEELCGVAKKHAKEIDEQLAPSSLMFHNIQSSNFQNWDKFIKDELTIQNDQQSIRCDFGPYYLNQQHQPLIEKLQISIEAYRCDGSPISRLRNWLSELYKSSTYANNLLDRINEITQQSGQWNCSIMDRNLENLYSGLSVNNLILKKDRLNKTPIYDILQILSVTDAKGAKQ
jgi:CRISPR/Cas system-associated protein Cas10 (large subunit of type III CRISPR-Cas system)